MKARSPLLAGGDVIVTIGDIVRMTGLTRYRARASLRRELARDRANGKSTEWFIPGGGERRPDHYNLSLLERAHPSMFKTRYVSKDEYEELLERMDSFEAMLRDQKQRLNAVIAAHAETRRRLKSA